MSESACHEVTNSGGVSRPNLPHTLTAPSSVTKTYKLTVQTSQVLEIIAF